MGKAEVLLSLHGSTAHRKQVEAWQADMKAFNELKADYEDELRRLRGEAYQVATLYAIFQGVIFTAISQASLLSCKLWWCPVSLSVAVSIAAFLAIGEKFYSMGEVREDINDASGNVSALLESLDKVEQHGAELDLETEQPINQRIPRGRLAGVSCIASRKAILSLFFLMGFSSLVALFSYKSLCTHCPVCVP